MDLKQLMEDFRQLQTHRKQIKKHNVIENRKITHSARIQVSEVIRESNNNQANILHLYRSAIYREEIETYRGEHDEIQINLYKEVGKLGPLLIFDNSAQRAQFETALRFFMEYSDPVVVQ